MCLFREMRRMFPRRGPVLRVLCRTLWDLLFPLSLAHRVFCLDSVRLLWFDWILQGLPFQILLPEMPPLIEHELKLNKTIITGKLDWLLVDSPFMRYFRFSSSLGNTFACVSWTVSIILNKYQTFLAAQTLIVFLLVKTIVLHMLIYVRLTTVVTRREPLESLY